MKKVNAELCINGVCIGMSHPVYFIADIAANHDGDLNRAVDLIHLAAESGAQAAKFQHFSADTIVSDHGFKMLKTGLSHQKKWEKSVYDIYRAASVDMEWTKTLVETCEKCGIVFFTSPYSLDIVNAIDPFIPAYKIGSGDITWLEIIKLIASKGKPVILATGASNIQEVQVAVDYLLETNRDVALMQCNTNYTASLDNFRYIQLNVLKTYANMYPGMVLGLSDHTPGHTTVLGAVALGARIVEKHFTDNNSRKGPDHAFAMNPVSWRDMVDRTRELELALGSGVKKVEDNEKETVVVQRRCVWAEKDIYPGICIERSMLNLLRPAPPGSVFADRIDDIIGKTVIKSVHVGSALKWDNIIAL